MPKIIFQIVVGVVLMALGTTIGIAMAQGTWVSDIRVAKVEIGHLQQEDGRLNGEINALRLDTNERIHNLTESVNRLVDSNRDLVAVIRAQQEALSKKGTP